MSPSTHPVWLTIFCNQIDSLKILYAACARGAPHDAAGRDQPSQCEGAGRDAFNTILSWVLDPDNRSRVLWLHGPAHSGKSTVAQNIADLAEKNGRLGGSFFFSPGMDPTSLLPTLAHELTQRVPETRPFIAGAIERDISILDRNVSVQLQKLIVEPCEALGSSMTRTVVIIIDGLDQYGGLRESFQSEVVIQFGLALESWKAFPLRILMTSRFTVNMRAAFDTLFLRTTFHTLSLRHDFFWSSSKTRIFRMIGFPAILLKDYKLWIFCVFCLLAHVNLFARWLFHNRLEK